MLKIYNILQKMEFLKEVAILEYEEWADNPEEDKEARIERKIEKAWQRPRLFAYIVEYSNERTRKKDKK